MSSRLGCTAKLHCRHRSSWHPNFLGSTGIPALLSTATCSLCEFHVWSAKVLCTCACLWRSWLNIGTVVAAGFIYPGPELPWKFTDCSVELSESRCSRFCSCRASSPAWALTDFGGVLLFLVWKVSLWEHVFLKVMEKGRSYHINRGETRPNLLKEAKEDRAVPCVGLSVASDLNLVVWSLFISHLVGGITRRWYFPFSRWYYKIKTLAIHILCSLLSMFC